MLGFYRRYYRAKEQPAKLIGLLDTAQRLAEDEELRLSLAREMAQVAEEDLRNVDKAIDIWKGIVRLPTARQEAFSQLKRLYRDASPPKWNALRELLKEEIEDLEDSATDEKIALYRQIVQIYGEHLKLPMMVVNTYGAILALKPDYEPALEALSECYEEMGRWSDLIAVLQRRQQHSNDPAARQQILHKIAGLWIDRFGNHTKAIEPLEQVLQNDGRDERALTLLKDIHTRRRNWRRLIDLLKREARHCEGEAWEAALEQAAWVASERLNDAAESIEIWNEVLEKEPEHAGAFTALSELYRKEERWAALAEILHRQHERAETEDDALELLETLGDIYTNRLRGPQIAVEVWQQVLVLRPDHPKAVTLLRALYVQQGRWEDLESLFGARDQWGGLAETLTAAADRTEDPQTKARLYQRVGQIFGGELDNSERAIKAYERVLAVDGKNAEVCHALVDLYRETERWSRLLSAYETLLAQAEDDQGRLRLLEEIRQLCEERLNSKQLAFQWCVRAYVIAPEDETINTELRRLAQEADAYDELLEAYIRRVEAVEAGDDKQVLLREMARICEEELHRPEEAERFHALLLELDDGATAPLNALEQIYVQGQRWEELIKIYQRQAAIAQGADAIVERLFKMAFVQEERLADPVAAIRTYTTIVDEAPGNLKALRALERLYHVRGEWHRLCDVLQQQLQRVEDDEAKVEIYYSIGELEQEELGNSEAAIDALARGLELDPNHRPTALALEEQLASEGAQQVRVARILEPLYERSDDFRRLANSLEVMLAAETDAEQQRIILKRLLVLYERRLDSEKLALTMAERLFRMDPSDPQGRRDLVRVVEASGRYDELAVTLEAVLAEIGDEQALELDLRWLLTRVLDQELGRADDAEEHARRIVQLDPKHQEAFELLERVLRDKGRWIELREVLHRRRELVSGLDEEVKILEQICALNEDVIGDELATVGIYEEILKLSPYHADANNALERLYREAELWTQLTDFYHTQISFVEDPAVINDIKVKQSEVHARELTQVSRAVSLLEEVVAEDPSHPEAVDLLELLVTEDTERLRLTEILEALYERTERWIDLVTILLIRRDITEGHVEQVNLLSHIARIFEERLEDPQAAFFRYRDALRLDPANAELREAVVRLMAELELWEAGAEAWEAALAALGAEDLHVRGKLLWELAQVRDTHIGSVDGAIESYREFLELDPKDASERFAAADALMRLYEMNQEWANLVNAMLMVAEWREDVDQRQGLLERVAQVQEGALGDPNAAVETYQQLLDEGGTQVALDALERLFLAAERWRELSEILQRRIELAPSAEDRRELWRRVAEIYEVELEEGEETIAAYLSLLGEDPDDEQSLRTLSRIYAEAGRYSELYEVLQTRRELAGDAPDALELGFQLGELLEKELGDVPGAVENYREVLAQKRDHEGARQALEALLDNDDYGGIAAEILAPLFAEAGQWEEWIRVRQLQAAQGQGSERVAALRAIAEIYEGELDAPESAFEATREALIAAVVEGETGQTSQLLDTLQDLAAATQAWPTFVETLERIIGDVCSGELRARVHTTAARISEEQLDDVRRAELHYRQLLDLDATSEDALRALERILESRDEWEPLYEIVLSRAELVGDDEVATLLVKAAVLCHEHLQRDEDAVSLYERVLSLDPDRRDVLEGLDRLYGDLGRWAELADLLLRRAELAEELADELAFIERAAKVREDRLEDPAGALEDYRRLIELESGHQVAVEALERYLEDDALSSEAARVLEPIYTARQVWPKLIAIYKVRLEAADESDESLALMRRVAQLYEEQLEDLEEALAWYSKVFLEEPSDSTIRDQITRLAGVLDAWETLAKVYSTYLDQVMNEDDTSREVALHLGKIWDDRLYAWEPAKEAFERVLDHDPGDEDAFRLLEQLLMRHERWDDLLGVYQRSVDQTLDASLRRDLMFKIARVWEEALEDVPRAIDAYQAIFDEESDLAAASALDRLFREAERWEDLCAHYNRRMDLVDDADELLEMKFELGRVYERRLGDYSIAIDHYEEVLSREPAHAGAIGALEQLVLDRDQRFRIAEVLEPIYQAQDEWAKLVVIYDAQLAFIEDKDRRIYLLREIARLHEERGGSLELAFSALCQAFEQDPNDGELSREVERLAGEVQGWERLVEVLDRCVNESYDDDQQGRLLTRQAQLLEDKLKSRGAAVDAWRRVLSILPGDERAMSALVELLEILGRYAELVETLHRKADLVADRLEQQRAYQRIAEIHREQLPNAEESIAAWRRVLDLDPQSGRALDALDELYFEQENWADLVWVCQRKLELTDDPEMWQRLQARVAAIYEEKVEDNFEAIGALKTFLERFPSDGDALDSLDRLYTRESLWVELLDVVESKTQLAQDGDPLNGLRFRSGAILAHELGEADRAVDHFQAVVLADSNHAAAREALEALLLDEATKPRVAGILERLYASVEDVDARVRVMEVRLETVEAAEERWEVLMEMARLLEESLSDPSRAFDVQCRAFCEVPGDSKTRQEMDRLGDELGLQERLVEVYAGQVDEIYDSAVAKDLHRRIAELAESNLSDAEMAERHLRAAMDVGGEDPVVLADLDRVLMRLNKGEDLLEVLERRIQLENDPALQAELYFRTGEIQRETLKDLDGAFSAFRDALHRAPGHEGARVAFEKLLGSEMHRVSVLDVLEPLYEEGGDFQKVVSLLEVRLDTVGDFLERVTLLERMASIQLKQLDQPEGALQSYARAVAEDPSNASLLDALEEVAEKLGRFEDVVRRMEVVLGGEQSGGDGLRDLGLRVASWYDQRLERLDDAERSYRMVLQQAPDCMAALDGLDGIYRRSEKHRELSNVLYTRADLEQDAGKKRQRLVDLARLREEVLEDNRAATDVWRLVLELDESDTEALGELVRLHSVEEAWEELSHVLERLIEVQLDEAERSSLRHRLAILARVELDDEVAAINIYGEILDSNPRDQEALTVLEELHRRREDYRSLEEVLLRRLDIITGEESHKLLLQLAELNQVELGNLSQATQYLRRVLEDAAQHDEAYQRLSSLLRDEAQWYDLIELKRAWAQALVAAGEIRAATTELAVVARLWTDELENPEAAAEVLEEILQQDEANVRALAELARIYEATAQWDRCAEVLRKAESLDPRPEERAELAFRHARVLREQGGDAQEVKALYFKACELAPNHHEAGEALGAFLKDEEAWGELAVHNEARVEHVEGAERVALLQELSQIYQGHLGRPEDAVRALELARELEPESVDVLVPLAEAYCRAERLEDAEPLLASLVEDAGNRRNKDVARYHQLLGLVSERRRDLEQARERYDKAYRMDSSAGATLGGLGRVYVALQDWQAARRIYRSMLLQNPKSDWEITKAEIFGQLGRIHTALGELAKARSMLERGLEIEPGNQVLKDALEALD